MLTLTPYILVIVVATIRGLTVTSIEINATEQTCRAAGARAAKELTADGAGGTYATFTCIQKYQYAK